MKKNSNEKNLDPHRWRKLWEYKTKGGSLKDRSLQGLNPGQQLSYKEKEKKYLMQLPDDPNRLLSLKEMQDFDQDGVIHVKNIIPSEWVSKIQEAVLAIANNQSHVDAHENPSGVSTSRFTWYLDDTMRDIIFRSPAAHLSQQLLYANQNIIDNKQCQSDTNFLYNSQGPVRFFYDQLFVKYCQGGSTPWHQDNSFWPIEGGEVITVWLPLTEVNINNGGLEYVLGSHKWNKANQQYSANPVSNSQHELPYDKLFLQRFPVHTIKSRTNANCNDGDFYEENKGSYTIKKKKHIPVSYNTSPGDALIFTSQTWHAAPRNQSTQLRAGLALRYFSHGVRYNPKKYGNTQFMPLWWNHGIKEQQALQGPFFPQLLPFKYPHEVQLRLNDIVTPDPVQVKQWTQSMGKMTAKL